MSASHSVVEQIEALESDDESLTAWGTGSPIAEYLSDIIRTPGYHGPGSGCDDTLKPTSVCNNGHTQFGASNPCTTRGCPHHWYRWRRERARSMVEQLAAVRYLASPLKFESKAEFWATIGREPSGPTRDPHTPNRRVVHLGVSPRQDRRWTTTLFWNHRTDAYEKAREVGARGAYCVPHAYRPSDGGEELWATLGGATARNRGKWRTFREYAGDDWEAMKALIKVAPHTHQIALATDIDGEAAKKIEAETGWAVENIRSLAAFYVDESEVPPMALLDRSGRITRSKTEVVREGYEDMARLAFYILEHSAVQPETGDLPRRNTVTSWGEVNTVNPEEDLPAAVWKVIQERVDRALPGRDWEEEEEDAGQTECWREECEASIFPISMLKEKVGNVDHSWWDSLGFDEQCELLGLLKWMEHKPPPPKDPYYGVGDLPPGGFERSPRRPPGVETREDFAEWLRRMGRQRYEAHELPFLRVGMNPEQSAA